MEQINAIGISCPQPVMMAKKAADSNLKEFEILVDNGAPKSNVSRFLKNSGYKVEIREEEDFVSLTARR